jgi:hypothetical protein
MKARMHDGHLKTLQCVRDGKAPTAWAYDRATRNAAHTCILTLYDWGAVRYDAQFRSWALTDTGRLLLEVKESQELTDRKSWKEPTQ